MMKVRAFKILDKYGTKWQFGGCTILQYEADAGNMHAITRPTNCCQLSSILQYEADAVSETRTPSRGEPIVANFLLFCNMRQMPSQKHARHHEANQLLPTFFEADAEAITRPTNCCQLS
jgi:hypothetical protein